MNRRTLAFIAGLAGLCLAPLFARAELVTAGPVRSIDNIPPEPVADLTAVDTPDDTGGSITLHWGLSADDRKILTPFGDFVVARGGLQGYRVYRMNADGNGEEELIAVLGPGVSEYVDEEVQKEVTYIYTVRPFDQENETDYPAEFGSAMDLARIATAIDNTYVPPPPVVEPVGEDGLPIIGWFSRQGDRVGFDDFFLFADNFGLGEGDTAFDPLFDIVPNGKVDFDDFFLFADNFGKRIVNADEVRGS